VVLRPLPAGNAASPSGFQPAWRVIERTQRQRANEYWLVTQPDHAVLAGALAAGFASPDLPAVDPLIARAIAVHDAGWAIFDAEASMTAAPVMNADGKPLSFLEIEPSQFLLAWTASIEDAARVCPGGGYIVSRHFCALGEGRLAAAVDGPKNTARLGAFLSQEAERREKLLVEAARSQQELDCLLLVLQFCDLLSLYLCCGAGDAVEFPQEFSSGKVRMRREEQFWTLEPSPFRRGSAESELRVEVRARRYPSPRTNTTTLEFLLR
jgi:Protein of unknown function (DUF3891)